jgi:hypothetical protein
MSYRIPNQYFVDNNQDRDGSFRSIVLEVTQLNELDDIQWEAIQHTTIIQQQRIKWNDKFI